MVKFSFAVLVVLGLTLTSYFGLAAWRASGGDQTEPPLPTEARRIHTNAPPARRLLLIFLGIQPIHDLDKMSFRYDIAKAGFGLQAIGSHDMECLRRVPTKCAALNHFLWALAHCPLPNGFAPSSGNNSVRAHFAFLADEL
jgi:hypothetical protein